MGIIESIIKRPVTPVIIFILLIGIGSITTCKLGVELLPEIVRPVLTVVTQLPGASPEEVEESITEVLEQVLGNVPNVNEISANVQKGFSSIILALEYGTDIDVATNDVRNRIDIARTSLPLQAQTQVLQFDPSEIPVIVFQVSANRDAAEIYDLADNTIRPVLERIPGVASSAVVGGDEEIVRVEVPLERLEAYDVTLTEISQFFFANNAAIFGGEISQGSYDYIVETSGQFKTIEDIRNAVVGYRLTSNLERYPVRIKDLADVYYDLEPRDTQVYVNRSPAVYITVQKRSATNAVQVSNAIIAEQEEILKLLPPDYEMGLVWDTTELIKDSLGSVGESAVMGAILAIIILLIFLRSIRTTLVIACSVPVSLMMTLLAMYFFDLTVNVMTLAGLALGVGMLVDCSIVVLENIFRYRERGASLTSSALLGSREMITAISASTLTTVGVFFPLVLFKNDLEVVGELFTALVLTVTIALLSSLLIAIILVPVLSSHYFRLQSSKERFLWGPFATIDRGLEVGFAALENAYKKCLAFLLKHRALSLIGVVVVFFGLIFLFPLQGFLFLPGFGEDRVELTVELPPGTQEDVTRNILFSIEETVVETFGVNNIGDTIIEIGQPITRESASVGGGGSSGVRNGAIGTLTVLLAPFEERTVGVEDIENTIIASMAKYPFVEFGFFSSFNGTAGRIAGAGGNIPIEIFVKGQNISELRRVSEEIQKIMLQDEAIINPIIDETKPMLQLNVDINRERSYDLGLNVQSIGREINALLDGIDAGSLKESERDYDIVLTVSQENRDSFVDLDRVFVFNDLRQKIRLSNIASYYETNSPEVIRRISKSRYVRLTAQTAPNAPVNIIVENIRGKVLEHVPLPNGVTIEYQGDYENIQKQQRVFLLFAIVSTLIVFGIMASLFESFLDPFIVLFTIPLSLAGVFVIYGITKSPMNSMTAVGFVMLIGIVVNTGIVLVDYTNLLRKRGYALLEACAEAGKNRLRPILMTASTTIFGIIPLAFRVTEGSELVQPIAKAVLGGLISATILTLFFVPVFYASINTRTMQFREWLKQRSEKRHEKYQEKLAERRRKLKG